MRLPPRLTTISGSIVDAERARAETPFGRTDRTRVPDAIAAQPVMREAIDVDGLRMTLNYGLNRVDSCRPCHLARASERALRLQNRGCRRQHAGDVEHHHRA
jgi:hypothetical protein